MKVTGKISSKSKQTPIFDTVELKLEKFLRMETL